MDLSCSNRAQIMSRCGWNCPTLAHLTQIYKFIRPSRAITITIQVSDGDHWNTRYDFQVRKTWLCTLLCRDLTSLSSRYLFLRREGIRPGRFAPDSDCNSCTLCTFVDCYVAVILYSSKGNNGPRISTKRVSFQKF